MRTLIFSRFVALLVFVSAAAVPAQKQVDLSAVTKAQWHEDLMYFARELPKRHKNAFHTVSKAEFEKMVADLDADIPRLAYHQVLVRLQQITAKIGDGHTAVHMPRTFTRYPIVLYWYGKDLRVTRAVEEYKDAIGTRVVGVGNLTLDEAQKRVSSLCSQAENEWACMSVSSTYMVIPEMLHTLGITADLGKASFTFETDGGKRFTRQLSAVVPDGSLNSKLIGAAREEPLSRLKPTEPFAFSYFPESQAVYVNFRTYENLGDNAKKLFQRIDANPVRKLIIDLRANGGGDFYKGRANLIEPIKQRPTLNQKGHLYVIIGRRTFSAAMVNAIDFRKQTNAILVGEPIGERPNSYSENDEMTLPNSQVVVSYSTRYYKFMDTDDNAVFPDKRIDPDWDSYVAGRDNVVDWILSN